MDQNKNIKKSPAEKRKETILKKRNLKEASKIAYHEKRSDKYILQAGEAYSTEKNKVNEKFKLPELKQTERERKKYEKKIVTEAINGLFKIITIEDDFLNIITYEKLMSGEIITIIKPNYTYIRNRLINIYQNELNNNKKNLRVLSFITIKYCIEPSSIIKKEFIDSKDTRYYNSETNSITSFKKIDEYVNFIIQDFHKDIENKPSSDPFSGIIKIDVKISKSKNIIGGSFVELPQKIKNKKACVNIKNNDEKCFLWSLIASKHYDDIKKIEVKHYKKYIDSIIIPENASFPVSVDDIPEWERCNKIKINVFILDDDDNIKIEYNTIYKNKNIINLLLYKNHYVWLKNIDRFEAANVSKNSIYRCMQCLDFRCATREQLNKHISKCLLSTKKADIKMPMSDAEYNELKQSDDKPIKKNKNKVSFINQQNEVLHPFHVIADFESTLEIVEDDKNNTSKYQKHVANSYGLKYNCIHKEYSKDIKIFNSSNSEEVIESFINELETLSKYSYKLIKQSEKNIIMTTQQKIEHNKANECSFCQSSFDEKNKKVRHHDHLTGEFISTLCNNCNLKFRCKKFLPVYIHNLKGYDSHLFISGLCKYGYQDNNILKENVTCIPNNEERYISFSKQIVVDFTSDNKPITFEIRFLDTFAFMASSIDSLSENLKSECKTNEDLRTVFKNSSDNFSIDDELKLMTEKGVYPYDYITSYDKFIERRLPHRKEFYSKLYNSECDENDYNKAINVWRVFKCKTLLDYHNIYLKSDVLLLSDIWDNFRNVCYKNYGLDCTYYYTAPGLSFDAMLKYTKITLELLTDYEQFEFVEKGIRGGISQISKRHAISNNKYMKNYDNNKDDSYIIYLDANNLYGHAMCQYLPYKGFKWCDKKWDVKSIMELKDDSEDGYLFEVNLKIPEKLHDYFNDYPLCPENLSIKKDELNIWQQQNYKQTEIKKLCLTLKNKENYILNYRYLKLCLSLGVELIEVNRVLEYKQSNFLSSYIMHNTNLRTEAKNDFEKDFYKLMNNSVYGKTMENVRNRINFKLLTTEDQAMRVGKNLKRFNIFNENLVGVHTFKTQITLDKPIYLGQNILDDSKVLMYNFHYNFMKKNIKEKNIDLLFTDTDSLCYHIKNEDVFEIIKNNKDNFDLSNYPKDHELYDKTNNKVIGKFKNESPNQILEFVGLRSKLYSFVAENDKHHHNKCKGVKRNVVEQELNINDYRDTLYTKENKIISQNGIRSYNHQIFSETMTKVALSCYDDKRFICDDLINTLSFGHYKINSK